MLSYIVEGGRKLEGEVCVSGSKNASLPIIAASILNRGITELYNVPKIHDTEVMLQILEVLGCQITKYSDKIVIDSNEIHQYKIPEHLMREMRSSVILAGAILAVHKEVVFSYPGGCDIGSRPIDLHLNGFEKLNMTVEEDAGYIHCYYDELIGSEISLEFPSVGATENIMLASIFAEGITVIKNAAMEPEIVDLANFLNVMGAKIKGAGSNEIIIEGVRKLKDVCYTIMPDRIEAGTLLCAAAITQGHVLVKQVNPEHITPVLHKLKEAGCELVISGKTVEIIGPKRLKAVNIKTLPYPGFPTDMQAIFASILTVAKGSSMIVENIFENRYKYTSELIRMGAKITIEGRTAVIKGVKKISAATVTSTDLRGGAAMLIAGLSAEGITKVEHIQYILRGYEKLDQKLNQLGANITIMEGD